MRLHIPSVALSFLCCTLLLQGQRNLYFFPAGNEFTATGKWVPSDPKDKEPYPSETQIDCSKASLSCVEATGDYYMQHAHVTIRYWKVNRWDNDGILATDSDGLCMTVTLLVSFSDKTLMTQYTMKQLPDAQKSACKAFGAIPTGEIFVIKNSPRWIQEHDAVWLPSKK